ncbi:hypothetical protein RFI_07407 [Reticulomyxa filosa]|uniref:Uncharacterized protein n=1 Tax=Reticulomyxa filosa TaxID=46433 RepID=X6NUZ2_RETFI|nr:hypothetical protein RFI_07407 [Reticulomyxa filosa]|eukprot:ETO29713.1 hypothetical protein RFI_07407 [Reticulomyxa filosa]
MQQKKPKNNHRIIKTHKNFKYLFFQHKEKQESKNRGNVHGDSASVYVSKIKIYFLTCFFAFCYLSRRVTIVQIDNDVYMQDVPPLHVCVSDIVDINTDVVDYLNDIISTQYTDNPMDLDYLFVEAKKSYKTVVSIIIYIFYLFLCKKNFFTRKQLVLRKKLFQLNLLMCVDGRKNSINDFKRKSDEDHDKVNEEFIKALQERVEVLRDAIKTKNA